MSSPTRYMRTRHEHLPRYTCERGMHRNWGRRMPDIHANEACTKTEDDECPSPADGCRDSAVAARIWVTTCDGDTESIPDSRYTLPLWTYNELSLGTQRRRVTLKHTLWRWALRTRTDLEASRTTAILVDRHARQVWVLSKAVTVFIYVFQLNISSHSDIKVTSLPPRWRTYLKVEMNWTQPIYLNLCWVISKYVYRNVYIEIGIKSMESFSFLFHALLCSSTEGVMYRNLEP